MRRISSSEGIMSASHWIKFMASLYTLTGQIQEFVSHRVK